MERAAPRQFALEDLLRAIESLRLGSVWLTLGVWLAILALLGVWSALFGIVDQVLESETPPYLSQDARTAAVIALLIAFTGVARRRWRSTNATWAPLRPLTRLGPEDFERLVSGEVRDRARSTPLQDALGALLGVGIVLISSSEAELLDAGAWDPLLVWMIGSNALLFVLLLRTVRGAVAGRRSSARIAAAIVDLDLLDTTPLRCFGRMGLRRAFFWVVGSSICALLALDLDRPEPTLVILSGTLLLATLSLVAPARDARQRVRRAKAEELGRVRERIRATRREALAGGAARELPGLLAYESRIEGVREWPFDTSTLVRFGALALLATGSWLGGALVEHLLDLALTRP